jgi:hypothetical protein
LPPHASAADLNVETARNIWLFRHMIATGALFVR